MLETISEGYTLRRCALVNATVEVYSRLSTYGGKFAVLFNGCDFASECPACRECQAVNERYWMAMHRQHPGLSARYLAELPPEELP